METLACISMLRMVIYLYAQRTQKMKVNMISRLQKMSGKLLRELLI